MGTHVIKQPMHFGMILNKLKERKYTKVGDIKRDIALIWSNCYKFNGNPDMNAPCPILCISNIAADFELTLNEHLDVLEKELSTKGYILPSDNLAPQSVVRRVDDDHELRSMP